MNILCADFVLTCNDNFDIFHNGAICFEKEIVDVGNKDDILKKYKNAKITKLPKNSVLMPGFVNAHTHLEFSSNIATLTYGSFIPWLNSVIQNREILREKYSESKTEKLLDDMLKSGVTTLGNISSFGIDLLVCKKSKQKIVYFIEAIGSVALALDALYSDFKARVYEALDLKDEKFIPALSVHSPYSTHPIITKKVVELAKNKNLIISTHFMESYAERCWIDNANGEFKDNFFNNFNPDIKPMYKSGLEFLNFFDGVKTLFTHSVFANESELEFIKSINASITHCPTSNRLLVNDKLNLQNIKEKNILLSLGTDGLSSNTSLNLWDEMRNAIYLHTNDEIDSLAKTLILSSTNFGAKALSLKTGQLDKNYQSDIISFCLEEIPKNISNLCLQIILQTKSVDLIYINGEKVI